MNRTILTIGIFTFLSFTAFSQNYFTGELFEAYEWDLESLSKIDLKLESDMILQRRLLSKKEDRVGKRIKIDKQFYDEVVIQTKSDIEVVGIEGKFLEIKPSKKSDFTLIFGPNDEDDENYMVMVKEMKGDKGVIEYQGLPFRITQGSRLTIGKLKKRKLPPRRTSKVSNGWTGNATAILIDANGYLITNYHVVEDTDRIAVVSPSDGKTDLEVEVIIKDKGNDLAILKIVDDNNKYC